MRALIAPTASGRDLVLARAASLACVLDGIKIVDPTPVNHMLVSALRDTHQRRL